jgi:tetratricopeptide (TPR) repeat protein
MTEKKTGIKKEYAVPSKLFNFIHIALAILIIGCAVLTAIFVSDVMKLKTEVYNIKTKIENTDLDKNEISGTEAYFLEQYKELSNKTDTAIERILTIVGIAAGFTAVFGALLAFRAPDEINRNMDKLEMMIKENERTAQQSIDELNGLINQAEENDKTLQESIREAKYYAEIAGALSEQEDENFTIRDKIDKLDRVIKEYPDLSHAYYVRGDLFHVLSNMGNKTDERYSKLAIQDFEKAMELGERSAKCYCSIAVEYSNTGEYDNAIEYFSRAIEDDNNNAKFYSNRGNSYEQIGEYDKANKDYNKAISLDSKDCYVFVCRALFYLSMIAQNKYFEKNDIQKNIKVMIDDFKKAKIINPHYPNIDKGLEAAYQLRDQYQSFTADPSDDLAEPQTEDETETNEIITP